jgi:hypothetical protein
MYGIYFTLLQECEKSLPILGNGHSATAQICTAAGGNKQKIYNSAVVSGDVCEGFTESSGGGDDSCDTISDSSADRGSRSSDGMHHLTAITTLGNSSISNTVRDSNSAGNRVTSCSGAIRSGSSNDNEICGGVGCEAEVVVLDFETTGLSSHKHRVIEVAAVILHGYKANISLLRSLTFNRFIYLHTYIHHTYIHTYHCCYCMYDIAAYTICIYMHTYIHTKIFIHISNVINK